MSIACNCIVLRKSVEHTVNVLDGLLYLNLGQVDGDLDPVYSTEVLWPGHHVVAWKESDLLKPIYWVHFT